VLAASQDPRSRFVGSSDHHVSEAFYFTDPEGNGIELYRDRPRAGWLGPDGAIAMSTEHLDPNAYLSAHLREDVVAGVAQTEAAVGHIHLQVGDLATAERFYVDALGFEITVRYPGALFVSAGGYHHHMGMNVWNSAGAPARAATLGLGEVAVTVPSRADVESAAERLRHHGHEVADDGRTLRVDDPWGSVVALTPAS
jgi:catechol 2,3-dioxygenase